MRRFTYPFVLPLILSLGARADQPTGLITPVPFTAVQVVGGFWGPRLDTNRRVTVWSNLRKCEETGRLANFARAAGRQQGGFAGIFFNDSDVFKVIEGASYALARRADPKLEACLDRVIEDIAAAQEDDGYLYSARTIADPDYDYPGRQARWSHLRSGHELYNVGHLYEAAVAHYRATGKRTLLDVAIRNADLVCRTFGRDAGQRVDVPGHEEIEIGLVKLHRATGERKYLAQASTFLDLRGRSDLRGELYGSYCQDHLPVVTQTEAVGHAVRAGYLYCGMADVAALTGERAYVDALDRIWENVVGRKLYLTGGIGARRSGEAFGDDYELPNQSAYNETCAAIANALWSHRMFLLHGRAKYIDVLERVLYNGFLAGVSLAGDTFFYPNPLACDGRHPFNHGRLERSPWFDCSCCPVNVVRFLPSLGGFIYATRGDVGYVNLYTAGSAELDLGLETIRLTQQTRYPWDGEVILSIDPPQPAAFELRLRIPGWARGRPVPSDLYRYAGETAEAVTLAVNGEPTALTVRDGYAVLRRSWRRGDTITLRLPMPVRRVLCHGQVRANRGRVALERGPIVYCVEGADHDGRVLNIALPDDARLTSEHRPDLLGGVTVVRGIGRSVRPGEGHDRVIEDVPVTAIPYYAWCHRGPNEMTVWLPWDPAEVPLSPPAAAFKVKASHCWSSDSVNAVNDGLLPDSSSDHSIPRLTWWDHRGTAEWVEYRFPEPRRVNRVEVYWFDDTGRGQCRVPQSWQLLYLDSQAWKPVTNHDGFGRERDTFNRTSFDPVTTDGLRVEVQLQPTFSAGILEWRAPAPRP